MILQEIRAIKSGRKELREFGITLGIILALLAALFLWREKDFYPYLFILAGLFLIFGAGAPIVLKPLQKAWMALAVLLGWLMTRVVLVILFYGVFTPIGFVPRLFGAQFLELKWNRSAKSYWIAREPEAAGKADYERPF